MNQQASIYIHIPFCIKKCNYCDFCSAPAEPYIQEKYINALCAEIKDRILKHPISEIKSIYIGGGTPSVLKEILLEQIVYSFVGIKFSNDYEFTLEINPATVDKNYFRNIKSLGINRLSIGVQSFDDKLLKILGRAHSVKDVYRTIKDVQETSIKNISIDLMYGLPEQKISQWKNTLNEAAQLGVKHISAYGLKIEEGTPFYSTYNENNSSLPSEETVEEMFYLGHNLLTSYGFKHYEISNYALPGFESKHNINYWDNNNYYAFGLAAHGYLDTERYENTTSLEEYIKDPLACSQAYTVSNSETLEEAIFLGLRKLDGINLNEFKKRYKLDLIATYQKVFDKYSDFFDLTENNVRLNLKGIILSNSILAEFL